MGTMRRSTEDLVIKKRGHLDIILGSMCSGKSTELLRRLSTFTKINMKVLYINSMTDTREFTTHNPFYSRPKSSLSISDVNNKEILCKHFEKNNIAFASISELKYIDLNILKDAGVSTIGIDEAQFFSNLYDFSQKAVEEYDMNVIMAGLDGDRYRKKFGEVLDLIPICDTVVKLHSYCKICDQKQEAGLFSHLISENREGQNVIGGTDIYIPVCRECYLKLKKNDL